MGLRDFHAPRALRRRMEDGSLEFEELLPVARRARIEDLETPFRERDGMRGILLEFLNSIDRGGSTHEVVVRALDPSAHFNSKVLKPRGDR